MDGIISPVVNQIIMLFIIAAIGLGLRLKGIFTDQVIKAINTTVLNVAWPCMAIMTTQKDYTAETLHGFLFVLGVSVVGMALAYMIAWALFFRNKQDRVRPVLINLSALPNAGFMGLPIVQAAYGDVGVLYLAAFVVGFNVVLWTIGASMYTGFKLKALKNLLSPGFIGAILGVVLFLARIRLPEALLSAVTQIGSLNTPLSMLLLGSRMDTLRLKHLADWRVWVCAALKNLAMPLALCLALRLAGVTGILLTVPVMLMAMPPAAACQMLSERYDADVSLAARSISIATLLSVLTIPLVILACGG